MCLKTCSLENLPSGIGYGWKEFIRSSNRRLVGECSGNEKPRAVGKWLDERDFRNRNDKSGTIRAQRGGRYPIGWHVWSEDFHAVCYNEMARIVKFKEVVAKGKQWREVVIAKKICILSRNETIKWLKKKKLI